MVHQSHPNETLKLSKYVSDLTLSIFTIYINSHFRTTFKESMYEIMRIAYDELSEVLHSVSS